MGGASSSSTSRAARAASRPWARRPLGRSSAATGSPRGSCSTTCRAAPTPTTRATAPRCVASRSPLPGLFFDSTFGGRWPATMKRTGFDALVITGQAPGPVYLKVGEAGVEVKPADSLWGKTTRDTVHAIQAVEGAETDVMAIGPAGERRVRFACLATYWKNREGVAGRGGIGAVLGAKRVKAVVVTGGLKTGIDDPVALKALLDEKREPLATGVEG